jgi:hypothetical protein
MYPGDEYGAFLFGMLCGALLTASFCGLAHALR